MKFRGLLFCCVLLIRNMAFAQISAIDISNDFGYIASNPDREISLLSKTIGTAPYTPASFKEVYYNDAYNCVNLALVFKPKPVFLKSSFPKQELTIGAGFLTINSTVTNYTNLFYDSIGLNGRTYNNHISFNLYTHREQVHASYLLNSKVFGKRFKAYFGLGMAAGFNTIKSAQRNTSSTLSYSSRLQSDTMFIPDYKSQAIEGAYHYTTVSGYIPVGLKYNIDCNFNFFIEIKTGIQFQPGANPTQQWQNFSSFGLGIRYKFAPAEDKDQESSGFW